MDQPIGKLDPDKLKEDRKNVDLGTEETDFSHVDDADGGGATGAKLKDTTSGATPPAR